METTLEMRWFVKGAPPAVVQHWFKFECPGELLAEEPETREDLYAYQKPENVRKFREIAPYLRNREEINFKLREGNLELKLQQQKLGTQQFGNVKNSIIWEGNIEQWSKLTEQELKEHYLFNPNSIPKDSWISVTKKREQRVERSVESELTWLAINGDRWWSIAFEMTQDSNEKHQLYVFKQAVDRASQTYYGPKLSVENSYGYGHWVSQYAPRSPSPSKSGIS
jgi:hypothetical protein